MKKSIFTLLSLLSFPSRPTNVKTTIYSGTLIMSCITKDGIVLVADSRAVFIDNGVVTAYFEGEKKIFQYKKILVAVSGALTLNGNLKVNGLFTKFNKETKRKIRVEYFYDVFMEFAKRNLSERDFLMLKRDCFIINGYINNNPAIYKYRNDYRDSLLQIGFITNDIVDKDYSKEITNIFKTFTISETTDFVKKFIESKIIIANKNGIGHIGGGLSIANIYKHKINWKQRNDSISFNSKDEFVNSFNKHLIKFWYKSYDDSIRFILTMKKFKS